MAINRGAKTEAALPAKLEDLMKRAFTDQAMICHYETSFEAEKADIIAYLEHNTDGFSADLGKGFKAADGQAIYTQRSNFSYDKDKIMALLESGAVTLATLLNCASFSAEKLKVAIGETNFKEVAVNKPTEYLTLRANAEFKAEIAAQFSSPVAEVAAVVVEAPKAPKVKAPKASKPKAKTVQSIDDDLAAILGK